MTAALPIATHPHDRRWVAGQLQPWPPHMAAALASEYDATHAGQGRRAANLQLLDTNEQITPRRLRLAADEDTIRAAAERAAAKCSNAAAHLTTQQAFRFFQIVAQGQGVAPPRAAAHLPGYAGRLSDPLWWRRQLRQSHGRAVETVARRLGLTHQRAGLYVSDDTVKRRQGQRSRNRAMLEAMIAVNEQGQEYSLQQLADLTVSNPALRRAELMTRTAGFELVARQLGHVALFLTVTCPSRYHAHHVSGERNDRHDGSTPRDGAAYLAALWARARAALHRRNIRPYGLRVAEPHHDGTPHWHLLLFVHPGQAAALVEVLRAYAMADTPDEPGADRYRYKAVEIDPAKGSATGYVAKYVAKMIDGHGVERDLFGQDMQQAVIRVDAWAATWGIRQFQQIGGPPVGVWREARRLDEGQHSEGVIGRIVAACNAGKGKWSQGWADFVAAMGGVFAGRREQAARVARVGAVDEGTGEVRRNRYGEDAAPRVVGIETAGAVVVSRVHQWTIKRADQARDLLSLGRAAPAVPWSPVNNCTPQAIDPGFVFADRITMREVELDRAAGEARPKVSMLQAMIAAMRRRKVKVGGK